MPVTKLRKYKISKLKTFEIVGSRQYRLGNLVVIFYFVSHFMYNFSAKQPAMLPSCTG